MSFASIIQQTFNQLGTLHFFFFQIKGYYGEFKEKDLEYILEDDKKARALFEFLISNINQENIISNDYIDLINSQILKSSLKYRVQQEFRLDEQQLKQAVLENDIQRALNLDEDLEEQARYLEYEISLIDAQINIKASQLKAIDQNSEIALTISNDKNEYSQKESTKTERDIQMLLQDTMEELGILKDAICKDSELVINDQLIISLESSNKYDQQQVLQNYNDKIPKSKIEQSNQLVLQTVNSLNVLTQNVIIELRNEINQKTDVNSLKEHIGSQELESFSQEKEKLLTELTLLEEQMLKVKKDNLGVRIMFQRWKQSYEELEKQKRSKIQKKLNQKDDLSMKQQQNTQSYNDLIDQFQENISISLEIVRQEALAIQDLQSENIKEQVLLEHMKQAENQLALLQKYVYLILVLVEQDQYYTQTVFDKFQTILQTLEQIKYRLDIEEQDQEQLETILKERNLSRTTIDERDHFMIELHKLLVFLLQKDDSNLFSYKADIVKNLGQLLERIKMRNKQQSVLAIPENFQKQNLIEMFKSTFNRLKGELISNDEDRQNKINEINQLLDILDSRVQNIEKNVQIDIEKHTAKGNGEIIKEEEVLVDFLNNKSNRLKQIIQ